MDETSQEFMDCWEVHQSEYGCNYIGSSSGVECKGALNIWEQSVEKYKLCYTSLIADGDSKIHNLKRKRNHIQTHNGKETTYNLIKENKPHTTS